ncbi:MAG: hypothetical protein A2Y64_09380 [Candidatus Coatesbacteria bacterium RBG_13_66_14]|uniref:Uncharacterized protein n=1 Tax=Candidatus Coatesbacteria bacterium RBG_13_66_14 TaxID=1817816 RepID=A0A1F5FG05_9BACT|nr:MAG: hypothetical protein A2Y64_09380 [Candidatus Coatesbacteria bacterium RBG_13_66_14]
MVDLARHHSMVVGALAAGLFSGARVTYDPGLLHRLAELPTAGLVSISPQRVELLEGSRALVELEVTLSLARLGDEETVWDLTSRCASLWRLLNRAAEDGLPYVYTHGESEISGHTAEEWLSLEGLAARYWRTSLATPPRPAYQHATVEAALAVVAPR